MKDIQTIKDKIVSAMLPGVQEKGWSWALAEASAVEAGFQDNMCRAVFPEGLCDVVAHFTDQIDRKMMERLEIVDSSKMRVRDRIKYAVMTRFDLLESMGLRKAVKSSLSYWAVPVRVLQGQRVLWRTTDRIWKWAGDTSKDYNHYTKRGLLSSLMVGTTLVWLDDMSEDKAITEAFLDRRLENIMEFGRAIGTIGTKMTDTAKRPWTSRI